jgi:tRNA (guanine26-N2/guanine27-N2)-dimethyltransferase
MTLKTESDAIKESMEGRAKLRLHANADTAAHGVFYNSKMTLNRDIAILFSQSYFSQRIRVCDPMTGSGIRAVRYLLESPNVDCVVAADKDGAAVEAAKRTVQINGLTGRISILETDANLALLRSTVERFDLVDLDPFGSPAPFFESAARATMDGGVIAATATDMGPLTGARAAACVRKYGVRPVQVEFEKEMAIRTLAACLAGIVGRLELGVDILFSHASDHYARIYAVIRKGRTFANQSTKSLGFIEYCPECLNRASHHSLDSIHAICEHCGTRTKIGGPIWLGWIWDAQTVKAMIGHIPSLDSSRLSEVQNLLTLIDEENNAPPFHYRTDAFAKRLRTKPPQMQQFLEVLRESGYKSTRTHFHTNGFRTDATISEIASLMHSISKKP